ncbi:VOC family protein [Streptomyces sp. CAI-121]|uniref:VOC family protein n=1 Tax=unclassified Streptomyces TaxID=2593676 RepID=UPI0015870088|nr:MULTISPECIES: VOC family protein [unclassified Streptomyces]NUV72310.1 VOC family protein [Streptomyces sp. CAI-121]NUW18303.1 VOC family protein [Streptomyces sp. CAI-68]
MPHDTTRLHHVGHIVEDLAEASALYGRLGFVVPPPSCPAMPRSEGGAPEPFGAANTHADFPDSFLELATRVKAGDTARLPADTRLVPLEAPPEVLPLLVERIGGTSADLAAFLDRFQGLHILMFSSPAIDAAAARLTSAGVRHGGVNTVRRAAPSGSGSPVETIRYLEIDAQGPNAGTATDGAGTVPEGRVGIVADLDPGIQSARHLDHPNGATGLAEATLCVADEDLAATHDRYTTYLNRPARQEGRALIFDLDGAALKLIPESALPTTLPGEKPPALPALVAYTVTVRDLPLARDLLHRNDIPVRETAAGELFVPAEAALGTAVVFRAG